MFTIILLPHIWYRHVVPNREMVFEPDPSWPTENHLLSLDEVVPSLSVPSPKDYAPSEFGSQNPKTSKDRSI